MDSTYLIIEFNIKHNTPSYPFHHHPTPSITILPLPYTNISFNALSGSHHPTPSIYQHLIQYSIWVTPSYPFHIPTSHSILYLGHPILPLPYTNISFNTLSGSHHPTPSIYQHLIQYSIWVTPSYPFHIPTSHSILYLGHPILPLPYTNISFNTRSGSHHPTPSIYQHLIQYSIWVTPSYPFHIPTSHSMLYLGHTILPLPYTNISFNALSGSHHPTPSIYQHLIQYSIWVTPSYPFHIPTSHSILYLGHTILPLPYTNISFNTLSGSHHPTPSIYQHLIQYSIWVTPSYPFHIPTSHSILYLGHTILPLPYTNISFNTLSGSHHPTPLSYTNISFNTLSGSPHLTPSIYQHLIQYSIWVTPSYPFHIPTSHSILYLGHTILPLPYTNISFNALSGSHHPTPSIYQHLIQCSLWVTPSYPFHIPTSHSILYLGHTILPLPYTNISFNALSGSHHPTPIYQHLIQYSIWVTPYPFHIPTSHSILYLGHTILPLPYTIWVTPSYPFHIPTSHSILYLGHTILPLPYTNISFNTLSGSHHPTPFIYQHLIQYSIWVTPSYPFHIPTSHSILDLGHTILPLPYTKSHSMLYLGHTILPLPYTNISFNALSGSHHPTPSIYQHLIQYSIWVTPSYPFHIPTSHSILYLGHTILPLPYTNISFNALSGSHHPTPSIYQHLIQYSIWVTPSYPFHIPTSHSILYLGHTILPLPYTNISFNTLSGLNHPTPSIYQHLIQYSIWVTPSYPFHIPTSHSIWVTPSYPFHIPTSHSILYLGHTILPLPYTNISFNTLSGSHHPTPSIYQHIIQYSIWVTPSYPFHIPTYHSILHLGHTILPLPYTNISFNALSGSHHPTPSIYQHLIQYSIWVTPSYPFHIPTSHSMLYLGHTILPLPYTNISFNTLSGSQHPTPSIYQHLIQYSIWVTPSYPFHIPTSHSMLYLGHTILPLSYTNISFNTLSGSPHLTPSIYQHLIQYSIWVTPSYPFHIPTSHSILYLGHPILPLPYTNISFNTLSGSHHPTPSIYQHLIQYSIWVTPSYPFHIPTSHSILYLGHPILPLPYTNISFNTRSGSPHLTPSIYQHLIQYSIWVTPSYPFHIPNLIQCSIWVTPSYPFHIPTSHSMLYLGHTILPLPYTNISFNALSGSHHPTPSIYQHLIQCSLWVTPSYPFHIPTSHSMLSLGHTILPLPYTNISFNALSGSHHPTPSIYQHLIQCSIWVTPSYPFHIPTSHSMLYLGHTILPLPYTNISFNALSGSHHPTPSIYQHLIQCSIWVTPSYPFHIPTSHSMLSLGHTILPLPYTNISFNALSGSHHPTPSIYQHLIQCSLWVTPSYPFHIPTSHSMLSLGHTILPLPYTNISFNALSGSHHPTPSIYQHLIQCSLWVTPSYPFHIPTSHSMLSLGHTILPLPYTNISFNTLSGSHHPTPSIYQHLIQYSIWVTPSYPFHIPTSHSILYLGHPILPLPYTNISFNALSGSHHPTPSIYQHLIQCSIWVTPSYPFHIPTSHSILYLGHESFPFLDTEECLPAHPTPHPGRASSNLLPSSSQCLANSSTTFTSPSTTFPILFFIFIIFPLFLVSLRFIQNELQLVPPCSLITIIFFFPHLFLLLPDQIFDYSLQLKYSSHLFLNT